MFRFQTEIQDELLDVQPHFRSELLEAVSQFAIDVEEFENSYTEVFLFLNVIACVEHSACF